MKTCARCKTEKELNDFPICRRQKSGYYSYCKRCSVELQDARIKANHGNNPARMKQRIHQAAWYQRNREAMLVRGKEQHLLRKFGLTPVTFALMVQSQKNRCIICDDEEKLVVDHSHKTGRVRGLLCHRCNMGLGSYRDRPDLLRSAIKYLEERET